MNRVAYLIASLSLHGALGLLFLFDMPPRPEEEKIEIVIRETRPSANKGRAGGGNGKRRGPAPGPSLRALSPKGGGMLRHPGAAHYQKVYAEAKGSGEWREEDFGSHGVDLAQFGEHALDLEQLRFEVEGLLFYPGALARRKIQGVINARLTFAEGSRCDARKTRVSGAHPYLRVYVLALLKKLCGLSALERMRFRPGQWVDLSFDFYVSELPVDRAGDERMSRVAGNVITFRRGIQISKAEWELGPLRGSLLAPGMVFLNTPWVLEKWDQYINKVDPLKDFRD